MRGLIALAAGIAISASALAQSFPTKPVRILVGFPVGNSPDLVARTVGDELSKQWGQPVIIENRAGAAAILASEAAAKATADGHTIYLATLGALGLNPHLFKKLPYDSARDFVGITVAVDSPFALAVHPSVPAANIQEFVAWTKAQAGKANYGVGASFAQMLGAQLERRAGAVLTPITYKGVQLAVTDLISGQLHAAYADLVAMLPHHRAGKLRILGVTSARRAGIASDLPTVIESGVPGYDFVTWYGFVAPAATPRELVERLNVDIVRTLERPEVRQRLTAIGLEVRTSKPEAFTQYIASEITRWGPIVREAGITPQ
jgi:tripartite-type tricarboxylate transporter receptor subunit TctC